MNRKQVVESYMEGFREGDHHKILSCLADDVVWILPGYYHKKGKEEFDKEIENEAFVGRPRIQIFRLVEEGNVVVAEGSVKSEMKNGDLLDAVFCDVFVFEDDKIKQLTSYLMQNKPANNSSGEK